MGGYLQKSPQLFPSHIHSFKKAPFPSDSELNHMTCFGQRYNSECDTGLHLKGTHVLGMALLLLLGTLWSPPGEWAQLNLLNGKCETTQWPPLSLSIASETLDVWVRTAAPGWYQTQRSPSRKAETDPSQESQAQIMDPQKHEQIQWLLFPSHQFWSDLLHSKSQLIQSPQAPYVRIKKS